MFRQTETAQFELDLILRHRVCLNAQWVACKARPRTSDAGRCEGRN